MCRRKTLVFYIAITYESTSGEDPRQYEIKEREIRNFTIRLEFVHCICENCAFAKRNTSAKIEDREIIRVGSLKLL